MRQLLFTFVLFYFIQSGSLFAQQVSVLKSSIWATPTCDVCWENPEPNNQVERTWVRQAVSRTWELESRFRFRGWGACNAASRGIRIRIADTGPHVKALGRYLDGKPNGMELNFSFNNWSQGCSRDRQFCIEVIAVHEFGHALGIAHEHNDCVFQGCTDAPQGTTGDYRITPCDLHSVMNYCNPRWNGDGKLSALDIQGVTYLYGSPVAGVKNLVNTNSGLCLAVRGATRNNGEEGTIWTYDGNADKNWNIIDVGNGFHKIQSKNSNLYLAVGAGSREDGGRVVQYQDIGQQDVYWRFIPIGEGVYKIQNKNSGKFLAIGAGLRTEGAPLVQWGDGGQEDIKWKLAEVQITGIKNLVNTNSELCLAVRGATRNNGEEGTIWNCDGNADKNWNIIDAGNGFYKIQNRNSDLYLAVGAGSRVDGGRVVQYQDIGQQDIYWRFIPIGAGVYKIQNKNSGLFLAIGAGLKTGGAPLVQWGDAGQEDIKWRLVTY